MNDGLMHIRLADHILLLHMRITQSVHALCIPFQISAAPGIVLDRSVYCSIVFGETITLIDTGVAGSESLIFDTIRSAGRHPSEIEWVILTHSHPDHIGAAASIQDATGCSIAAHPAERQWIEDVNLQNHERPVPGFASLVSGSVQVDRELIDGNIIFLDKSRELSLEILHTPGHTPGSISLFMDCEGVLFSGDAVPVAGELPIYEDAPASARSIRRLQGIAGIEVLVSAWDAPRRGEEAYDRLEQATGYLQRIHETVCAHRGTDSRDLMALSRKIATSLGIPPVAFNPLLARTFAAHLRVCRYQNILESF